MKDYCGGKLFSSIKQAICEPKESKYVKKVMYSVNRRIKGEKFSNFEEDGVVLIQEQSTLTCINNNNINKSMESYVEICEQLSDNVTVDSGIISKDETVCKTPIKKLSFSPEHDKVFEIEVENLQPKFYDMPEKCVAHITETPKLQKVDYKQICSSTPQSNYYETAKEFLQCKGLTKHDYCKPELVLDLSTTNNTPSFVRSPSTRSVDEKFVVNLYESRQSKKWKRRSICLPDADTTKPFIDMESVVTQPQKQEPESHKTSYSEAWPEHELLDDGEMFQKLKKERDIECVKMVQASNVLKLIKTNPNKEWSDELLAEKILLETDEKYTILINKIRDLGYTAVTAPKPNHSATITLSNFEFLLKPEQRKRSKYSDFYIITLSHDTELLMSKATSSNENNKLTFDEQFTFANLNSEFNITVKIFSIKLKTRKRTTCSILGRKTKNLCPMSKIYYENINTYEMKESSVLKPSFKCCGEFIMTKNQIDASHFILTKIPSESRLLSDVNFSFKLDNLKINSNVSGFLTLGLPNKDSEVLFWERKWCVLKETNFSVYNYPSEEVLGDPALTVNFEYCLVPLQTNFKNCPRKRTFLLKTGTPDDMNDVSGVNLRKKPNFVVKKYFLAADDNRDFELWTNELQSTLNCLQDWHKLVFVDDYY